ncbi:MAG: B12-binding domain-containing radical SAM protein, partial [Rhodospirillales bacterium]|nr:B12-binding domain-containing radical SAM protein [Rhodospirillales bacterium]
MLRTRRVYLINPRAPAAFTTKPIFFGRALYSPLAGLLQVAALIPQDQYEVVLTDENIEEIDFDLACDLVGISAMTSYVNRGYQIADKFRARGVPVVMGGVHPSFMPDEALQHADAVVIGEAEYVMDRVLADLEAGTLRGTYKADRLHTMQGLPGPRMDLIKKHRYFNRTFIQTARGCHHACNFCSEQLLFGLKFRFRPTEEVIADIIGCGETVVALNDADFFGVPARAAEVMRALKGRGIKWQAGVNSASANDDKLLELAAESGCFMLSIGFESISKATLRSVHKYQNKPENYIKLVEKIHSHGILVFGLFMFGFDGDDATVFDETLKLNFEAGYDMCGYSILTPYPGTLQWFEMMQQGRVASFDWDKYDQQHIVYRPKGMTVPELQHGFLKAYDDFYSWPSLARRFPWKGDRSRLMWSVFNMFYRKGGL